MLASYGDFEKHLTDMVKIRAANYIETDCDIHALVEAVYNDIQNEVLLETFRAEYLVGEENNYELYPMNPEFTAFYTDVLDIVDENDISTLHYLDQVDRQNWKWKSNISDSCCVTADTVPACYVGRKIYFIQKKISKIENLPVEMYQRLVTAMLEGIMYYVQTALPNQVDGQVGNFSYQRFYNAKKQLINLQPQAVINTSGEPSWL